MNRLPGRSEMKCAVRAMAALGVAATLLLAAGCGSSFQLPGHGTNLGFSNASLNGQYAFTSRGVGSPDGVNSYYFIEGGIFTADGNGNITAGTDDFVENFQQFSDSITGTYTINGDGSGDLQFNFPAGGSSGYHITFSDSSHFYMEEADGFGTSGGSGEKQNTSAFSSIPSGTFVFRMHDLAAGNSKVGVTNWSAGQITGTEDVLSGGALSSGVSISGSAGAPGITTGRGTMTTTDSTGLSSYVYYVVNSNKLRFLNVTASVSLAIGQAETQIGAPFSLASLNGAYVFGSAGETANVDGIHTVGMFTTSGSGSVTGGSFDFVQDGNPVTNVSLNSGTYTLNSAGRADVVLNLSTGATNEKIMWLVSPSRAYFLINDPVNIEDGTLDQQTGAFSNGTMSGQYGLLMDGIDTTAQFPYRDRVGTWTPSGSGAVSTNYVASGFATSPPGGSANPVSSSGTYSVAGNGRATASINNLSNNLIFYLSSNNSGYMLQADAGVDIGGTFSQQTVP